MSRPEVAAGDDGEEEEEELERRENLEDADEVERDVKPDQRMMGWSSRV